MKFCIWIYGKNTKTTWLSGNDAIIVNGVEESEILLLFAGFDPELVKVTQDCSLMINLFLPKC